MAIIKVTRQDMNEICGIMKDGGSNVIFTDVDGNIFTYTVMVRETLMSTDVQQMESGGWDLTLFTCTAGGQNRVIVRCVRRGKW